MNFISSLLLGLAQVLCDSMNMVERKGHKTDLKQAISDLETATSELKAIRDDLNLRIQQENLEGRSCTNRAREWLGAVQAAEIKTESILLRFMRRKQRKRMRSRCLGCFGADYKLSKKVLGTLKSIGELRERSEDIKTDGGSIQETFREIPIKSVVGITTMLERVWEFLSEEEERGIIGVDGPGGVGKTTLMQSINNELITKGHQCDVLIWVTMSREFSEYRIHQVVGARLSLSWDEKETGEHRALKIYRPLKQKRFLLLLDDVWEEIDLEKTGVPRPDRENKCKVMFMTRSMTLCSNMGAKCKLRVEFLEKQYAWELFCDKVGRKDFLESLSICRLALQQNNSLKKIPTNFFIHLHVLRVLDLSFTNITEIPLSIKYLVELYHLTLSGTKISVLPQELGNLRKLKHLDLERTQFLQTIPRDAICWLSKLEVLNLYYSYAGWELQSFGEDEVEELGFADLEQLENLTKLGITVLSLESLKTFYEFDTLHNCIQHLLVEECNGLLYFNLPSLSNHGRNLKTLSIKSCHDLKYLVTPTDVDWFPSLEVLTLHSLHKLSKVWGNSVSQECLRKIRCINISHCHKLKNFSWVPQLPKLEMIDLFDCKELEELISEHGSLSVEDPLLFPGLKTLSIRDLPELSSILPSQFSFQKLETLVITNCPKVKQLPFEEKVQTNLPIVYCNEKWWDALEKNQPNEELCCLPRFVPN